MLLQPYMQTIRGLSRLRNSLARTMSNSKVITMNTINPNIRDMEYAVRGPIVARAGEIEQELLQVMCIYRDLLYFSVKTGGFMYLNCENAVILSL